MNLFFWKNFKLTKATTIVILFFSLFSTKSIGAFKDRTLVFYCGGKRKGYLTCDCTDTKFQSMANTMCYP